MPISSTVSLARGRRAPLSSVGLVAVVTLGLLPACHKQAEAKAEDAAAAPVHVQTADVTEIEAPLQLRLTGTLRGGKETDLAANAAGRVTKTMVERGQEVKQGMILAQLDTRAAALALAEARVAVATSKTQEDINKSDCERYEQLKAKGAVTELEYDQVTAKCKTAPLQLEAAQARQSIAAKNVGDGAIRAPFSGIVSERYVDIGEYVQASSKVVSIAQVDELRLEFTVPEASLGALKQDAAVQFTVAAFPNQTFTGKVRYISGAVRASTRDVVAEAVVENPERKLKPGMFADVQLVTGNAKLPSVPSEAVFERQQKKRVYVIADGHAEERVLQAGPTVDGRLAVQNGVKPGEKVAIGDLANLTNGARVD